MVGTGPFKFVEYTPGNEAKFVRNADYWNKDQPLLEELIIKYIPDDSSRLAALRNNSVDFAYFGSAIFVKPYLNDPAIQWAQGKALNTRHFVMNNPGAAAQRRAGAPGDQPVDQSAGACRHESPRAGRRIDPHSPADEFWTLPNPQNEAKYKNDVEQAKKLLADAGQSDLKIQTKIGPDASYTADSELVQSQFKRAGIELEIVKKEQAAWIDDFLKVNHDSVLMGYSSYVDPDGYFYQSMYSTSSSTRTGIKSEKLDGLLNKGRTTTEENQRQQVYYDIQKLVVEEAMELICTRRSRRSRRYSRSSRATFHWARRLAGVRSSVECGSTNRSARQYGARAVRPDDLGVTLTHEHIFIDLRFDDSGRRRARRRRPRHRRAAAVQNCRRWGRGRRDQQVSRAQRRRN